jgi:Ca2+-binding RTX toxin-like protein
VALTGADSLVSSTIDGAAGDDRLTARSGIVEGGEGDDVLTATLGARLRGGPGADRLGGSPSADVLDGGPGSDVLDGGGAADVVSYAGRTEPVVVDLGAGTAGADGEHDAIANLEGAQGGDGADRLRARPDAAARLDGGGGDDVLEGGPLDDYLYGGAGADRLASGEGHDDLDGDDGDDVLDGGDGRDGLEAGDGDDSAAGGRGNDQVDDGYGHDVVHGDAGADELAGEIADGGDGNDKLEGALLIGGPGDDHLLPDGRRATERVDCGPGRDTVERPARRAILPPGCELVTPVSYWKPAIVARPVVRRREVALRFPYPCMAAPRWARCRIAGELFVADRRVASAEVRWARDRRQRVIRWRVPARVRRMIGRGAVVRFALSQHEAGDVSRGGYALRLTAPGAARRQRATRAGLVSAPALLARRAGAVILSRVDAGVCVRVGFGRDRLRLRLRLKERA